MELQEPQENKDKKHKWKPNQRQQLVINSRLKPFRSQDKRNLDIRVKKHLEMVTEKLCNIFR